MDLIEWRDEFAIGLDEVDHEHRALIGMINALHAGLRAGADVGQVCEALGEIHARIGAHFALEEKSMVSLGYAGYALHKADHEVLLNDIRDIMDEVEAVGRYDPAPLAARLATWFVEHFRTHDAWLHQWLVDSGASVP